MHVLNHRGRSFQVKGPLNLQRSPQGHPVTFQAGSSESGRSFAARQADAVFAREYDMESAKRFYADIKNRATNAGRNPDHVKIFMGAQVVVAPTAAEAEEKYERILSYVSDEDALQNLEYFYNHMDFSKYDLDAPFPDVTSEGAKFFRGFTTTFANDAKRLNLTLRQVARRVATLKEDFFGTPNQVADAMETWLSGGAMDGFMIGNWVQPDGLQDFVELVVPELKRRGLYSDQYRGNTLRENLGVPIPMNRYARGHRSSPAA
jgi:FMN-dependent oxidoreductase (nitrilotriacetate monooxygenase family)